jgi:protein tyrosine/serine phosphatase
MTRAAELRDPPRIVPTTGIHNFRDCGGYPVIGGGHLACGTLYRSGEHAHATDRDLALVSQLGLSAIFDLRGTAERQKAPCRRPEGFSAPVYFADGETTLAAAPHLDAAASAFDAETARRNMCERYASVPFRSLLVDIYRQYFRFLAQSTGPTLIYCTAGKDRTGVLVALFHSALGIHRDDIFNDYMLTNTAGDAQARVDALKADLQRRFGALLSDEAVRVVTSVEPLFLEAAFEAIIARHGSVESYLEDVLFVPPVVRHALAARFVE